MWVNLHVSKTEEKHRTNISELCLLFFFSQAKARDLIINNILCLTYLFDMKTLQNNLSIKDLYCHVANNVTYEVVFHPTFNHP